MGFLNGMGHRLFAVNIFSCFETVDGHFRMPVVRSGNANDINVLVLEELSIVLEFLDLLLDVHLFVGAVKFGGRFVTVTIENVAYGYGLDLTAVLGHVEHLLKVRLTPATNADESDANRLVGSNDSTGSISARSRSENGCCRSRP